MLQLYIIHLGTKLFSAPFRSPLFTKNHCTCLGDTYRQTLNDKCTGHSVASDKYRYLLRDLCNIRKLLHSNSIRHKDNRNTKKSFWFFHQTVDVQGHVT